MLTKLFKILKKRRENHLIVSALYNEVPLYVQVYTVHVDPYSDVYRPAMPIVKGQVHTNIKFISINRVILNKHNAENLIKIGC